MKNKHIPEIYAYLCGIIGFLLILYSLKAYEVKPFEPLIFLIGIVLLINGLTTIISRMEK